jgi:hypothetical protein
MLLWARYHFIPGLSFYALAWAGVLLTKTLGQFMVNKFFLMG